MDGYLLLAFILTSVVLIVVPGPNVLVIVSTSIAHGTVRGLQTVLGTSSAMIFQLIVAALGTSWFVTAITNGFNWLRWAGVAYLIVLGLMNIYRLGSSEQVLEPPLTAGGTYMRGFIVSLTNPKTILFFSAFLPQFVTNRGEYMTQIAILSATFLLLATCLDGLYAVAAGRIGIFMQRISAQKIQKGVIGVLYLTAGVWLAAIRKS